MGKQKKARRPKPVNPKRTARRARRANPLGASPAMLENQQRTRAVLGGMLPEAYPETTYPWGTPTVAQQGQMTPAQRMVASGMDPQTAANRVTGPLRATGRAPDDPGLTTDDVHGALRDRFVERAQLPQRRDVTEDEISAMKLEQRRKGDPYSPLSDLVFPPSRIAEQQAEREAIWAQKVQAGRDAAPGIASGMGMKLGSAKTREAGASLLLEKFRETPGMTARDLQTEPFGDDAWEMHLNRKQPIEGGKARDVLNLTSEGRVALGRLGILSDDQLGAADLAESNRGILARKSEARRRDRRDMIGAIEAEIGSGQFAPRRRTAAQQRQTQLENVAVRNLVKQGVSPTNARMLLRGDELSPEKALEIFGPQGLAELSARETGLAPFTPEAQRANLLAAAATNPSMTPEGIRNLLEDQEGGLVQSTGDPTYDEALSQLPPSVQREIMAARQEGGAAGREIIEGIQRAYPGIDLNWALDDMRATWGEFFTEGSSGGRKIGPLGGANKRNGGLSPFQRGFEGALQSGGF